MYKFFLIIVCFVLLISPAFALDYTDPDIDAAWQDGYADGKSDGYNEGYDEGKEYGYHEGWKEGYEAGYEDNADGYYIKYTDASYEDIQKARSEGYESGLKAERGIDKFFYALLALCLVLILTTVFFYLKSKRS